MKLTNLFRGMGGILEIQPLPTRKTTSGILEKINPFYARKNLTPNQKDTLAIYGDFRKILGPYNPELERLQTI